MPGLVIAALYQYFFGMSLFGLSVFMILLVLVQRGRGGGLTGALGGAGGQSAFGAKAGDLFTRITAVTALVWFLLCVGAIMANQRYSDPLRDLPGKATPGGKAGDIAGEDPETGLPVQPDVIPAETPGPGPALPGADGADATPKSGGSAEKAPGENPEPSGDSNPKQ